MQLRKAPERGSSTPEVLPRPATTTRGLDAREPQRRSSGAPRSRLTSHGALLIATHMTAPPETMAW